MMVSRRTLLMLIGATVMARPPAVTGQGDNPATARVRAFYDSLRSVTAGAPGSDPKQRTTALSQTMMQTFDISAMTGTGWACI
ncbi:hypothetical protein [Microvirga sp. 2TAF3]|uniref:hypothetical protein n=1 Tax=Microvirga sp. 2TAF3 TaxID=3233014 RepID=UPI003F97D847